MVAPTPRISAADLYRRGRNDFIESVVHSLSDPSIQGVTLTVAQFVQTLKDCGAKCDSVTIELPKPPPK
jgi:catabolite regulation protein CreA